jgi:hypothetical protein
MIQRRREDELGGAHLYGWRKVNNVSNTDVVWRQRESCSSAQRFNVGDLWAMAMALDLRLT